MPRKPQPGPRTNRSDLPAASATQPVRVASGGRYGSRKASVAAQQAAPLPDRSTAAMLASATAGPGTDLSNATGGAGPGAAPGAVEGAPAMDELARYIAAAQAAEPPDSQGALAAPGNPNVPLTTGMDMGPGAGSDVLSPLTNAQGPDPAIVLWASALPAIEMLASRPDSSPQVRQFVRRLRSQLPPDYYSRTEQ
jgi:hypothetical protein